MLYPDNLVLARHDYANFPGHNIYAYAFEMNKDGTRVKFDRPPMLCMMAAGRTPGNHEYWLRNAPDPHCITHVVPYGKSGRPCWGQVMDTGRLRYADTMGEAVAAYNDLVKRAEAKLKSMTQAVSRRLIQD